MARTGVLLVGHGSRDPATRLEHDALEAKIREAFPDREVRSGFIELSEPALSDAMPQLASRCERVVVVPLLLFTGGHMQRDVPNAIAVAQRLSPATEFLVTPPFGTSPATVQLASARLTEAMSPAAEGTILLIGRGAAEEDARREFQDVLRALAALHPGWRFDVAYCGLQSPNVPDALTALADHGCARVIVLPYLLFTGRLHQDIARAIANVQQRHVAMQVTLADPLGPAVAVALAEQVQAASELISWGRT